MSRVKPPNAFKERSSCRGNFALRQFGDAYRPERDEVLRGLLPYFRKDSQGLDLDPAKASASRCGKGPIMLCEPAAANNGLLQRGPVVGVAQSCRTQVGECHRGTKIIAVRLFIDRKR